MRASRDLSQNDESSLPTSKQHSMPSARESSPMGSCPRRSSTSSLSQSRTSPNARTASRGNQGGIAARCNPRGAHGSNLGRRRDAGWGRLRSFGRCAICTLYPLANLKLIHTDYRLKSSAFFSADSFPALAARRLRPCSVLPQQCCQIQPRHQKFRRQGCGAERRADAGEGPNEALG
jgi:hypothetical protein